MSIFIPWLVKWESEILHHEWFGSLCRILNAIAVEGIFTLGLCSLN